MEFYAHSLPDEPEAKWQKLGDHLQNVADLAADFAKPFGGEQWARIAGLWHDVGKGAYAWQAYLRHANEVNDDFTVKWYKGRVEHAITAAQRILDRKTPAATLLAYCLAGHHGGLPNWEGSKIGALRSRLDKPTEKLTDILSSMPELPMLPPIVHDPNRSGYQIQFFDRMLFSCLVDADYLDTEAFVEPQRSCYRRKATNLTDLHEQFNQKFNLLRIQADKSLLVNQYREIVVDNCLKAAEESPGLFSLTVPTGGGKTLASMAFALKHAEKYGKRRIIYVVPFTSIIEQNAAVFRKMLGEDAVLEHHCNFIPDDADWRTRLATENWDAPVIVTTNVQFFDSFYANKPAKCRKLHNVANSVVIFDEIQAIPVERVKPCIEVLRELAQNYGTTSVLCTATQPALQHRSEFKAGLENVKEIVEDVPSLFMVLKRTKERYIGEKDVPEIAERLSECHQVLCIVNTRKQALDVFNAVSRDIGAYHLSAAMYPKHRSRVLNEIRERLSAGDPCRVVSTQLVEAGVDVDFPIVYRTVAGIDSIAQAAGRCNRNGRRKQPADVFVFHFPQSMRCRFFRKAAQAAEKLFEKYEGSLTRPDCVKEYFLEYFWTNEQRMDVQNTVALCQKAANGEIQFADIAGFHMIDSATRPIIVALENEALELLQALERQEHNGLIFRKLQQFTVQVYPHRFEELAGWCEEVLPGVWVLKTDVAYSYTTGLTCQEPEGNALFG